MGYWGWRPLIFGLFISSWVVGCAVLPSSGSPAAPSAYPEVTLTSGRLPTIPIPLQPTPTLSIANVPPFPTLPAEPPPLVVEQPICTTTPNGQTACIGRVDNPLNLAFTDVRLETRAITTEGEVTTAVILPPALNIIPPDGFAPYQVTFPDAPALVDARIIAAAPAPEAPPSPFTVERITLRANEGAFMVTTVIRNTSEQSQNVSRVLIALLDANNDVINYRVIAYSARTVEAGSMMMVSALIVVPGEIDGAVQAVVHAE